MRLVFIGPPGAGKGTQAAVIAQKLGIPAVSTGDLLRAQIASESDLGRQVRFYVESGELVPDSLVDGVVESWLTSAQDGFLLDGYPRTVDQARRLEQVLEKRGASIDAVISFEVETSLLVERLLQRARESGRVDDTQEVISERMRVFSEQTTPVVSFYEERGLVRSIEADRSVSEVTSQIQSELNAV